jgi:hypothetical protein
MNPIIAVLAVGIVLTALTSPARAEFQVRSPIVDFGELEIEHNGSITLDKKDSGFNHKQSYTNSIGYGVTPWWMVELEGEWGADADQQLRYDATTFENLFQLTPQGEYWADAGFFAEYSQSNRRGDPNTFEFGPIVQKQTGGFFNSDSLHTINLFLEKQVGHNRTDDTGFSYAWQSRLLLNPWFEPGFEIYGNVDKIDEPGKPTQQEHRIGPMFAGLQNFAPYGKLKYELGYLFGLTPATENGAIRWKLEYEIPF